MSARRIGVALLLVIAPTLGAQQPAAPALQWPAVAIATGLVTAASLFDQSAATAIHDHPSGNRDATANSLARFGTGTVIAPTIGILAVAGLVSHRRPLTDLALNTTKALVVATVAVTGLKLAAGRQRPWQDQDLGGDDVHPFSGDASFPSGHTTAAFAFATTLGDAIGKPWARVGLYALATGTAWSRVAQQQHWVSDVVAGAALGVAASKFATGRRTIFGVRAPRLSVGPHQVALIWGQ